MHAQRVNLFLELVFNLLEQMDLHSHHLHPDEIDVDKATWVAVFAKPGPTIGPTISILLLSLLSLSQLVIEVSHYEILKPSWLGQELHNSNLGSALVTIVQFLPLQLGFLKVLEGEKEGSSWESHECLHRIHSIRITYIA